ncbi:MAG TPA: shikimate kinase [Flavobacterium sp.]|nr:shikimate kinase [Flavobacterium sp.]
MDRKKILLVGYMASGKSTVGKVLANELGIEYLDLDKLIEQKNDKTVPEIFAEDGEIFFRKQEYQLLHEWIQKPESFVLSLGGGTPCYANNHLVFEQEDVLSVYLKAKVSTLVDRIEADGDNRPLLSNISDIKSYVGQHVLERSYYYNQAQFAINIDDKSVEEIVNEIKSLL